MKQIIMELTWSKFQLIGGEPGSYSTSVVKDLNSESSPASVHCRTCNSEAPSSRPAQHKGALTAWAGCLHRCWELECHLLKSGRSAQKKEIIIALLFAAVQIYSDRRRCFMQVSGAQPEIVQRYAQFFKSALPGLTNCFHVGDVIDILVHWKSNVDKCPLLCVFFYLSNRKRFPCLHSLI